jgi:hypothetical protein
MFANTDLPIWNRDKIESSSNEPMREHYILIRPKEGETIVEDGREWFLPYEHNLRVDYFTDILKLERYCQNRDLVIGRDYKIVLSTGKSEIFVNSHHL